MSTDPNRRLFMKASAAISAASAVGLNGKLASAADKPVRVGFVGVGSRGSYLTKILLNIPGVEVKAICDINQDHVMRSQKDVTDAGQPKPEGYSRGPWDFKRLCDRNDLDAVVTATPWEWHTPVAVAAMKAGKYAATEVPAAVTLDECWELVETSEKTRMPCMMLENVNYFKNVMMVLNMVRQNLLGELLHCEAGYQHDVRFTKVDKDGKLLWRGQHSVNRNGCLYPTHQVGPIGWWLDINRGNRFTYLTSMSTQSRGIHKQIVEQFGEDHPSARINFELGDINTTIIKCHNGQTVTLYHDTNSPRPYDLIFRVQGTDGIYSGTLNKIYIPGRSPKEHTWEDIDAYEKEFEHPMWKTLGPVAQDYGHGGGDYMEIHQFIKAVRAGTQTPEDVYDAATWSAISALSEQSVADRSNSVDFPDFTRGKWMTNDPIGIEDA